MAKKDLRWRKTENALMRAFEQCAMAAPVDRIAISALSECAEINKTTFYLHYRDIYDLARAYTDFYASEMASQMDYLAQIIDSPSEFVGSLFRDLGNRKEALRMLAQNGLIGQFFFKLTDTVVELSFEASDSSRTGSDRERATAATTFLVGGLTAVLARYPDSASAQETAAEILELLQANSYRPPVL